MSAERPEPQLAMEIVDGRDALGIVVFREQEDGQIISDIKGMKIDKLTAAKLFYQMAKQLKAMHDAEQEAES